MAAVWRIGRTAGRWPFRLYGQYFWSRCGFRLHPFGVRTRPAEMSPFFFIRRTHGSSMDEAVHVTDEGGVKNFIRVIWMDEEANSTIETECLLKRRISRLREWEDFA